MKSQMKMQGAKCPRFTFLKDRITITKKEIEELNTLIRCSAEELVRESSEFKRSEIRLKVLQSKKSLPKKYIDLQRTEDDLKKWKLHIQKFMDEANVDYEEVVNKGRDSILSDEKMKQIFDEYKTFDLEQNYEAKVMFYANIKSQLANPEEKK